MYPIYEQFTYKFLFYIINKAKLKVDGNGMWQREIFRHRNGIYEQRVGVQQ